MHFVSKLLVSSAMVGLAAACFAGCSNITNKPQATLHVGTISPFDGLDPADGFFSLNLTRYGIGETLVRFDNSMVAQPELAESWSVAADGLTWTFQINPKAKFSNGNPVTADAVKSSIERAFEKSDRAATLFSYDSITADGQTLTIRTTTPVPTLPGMLGEPLFVIIDTSVTDRDYHTMGPICTGPYIVKSFNRPHVSLEANPNYWNGAVPFQYVEVPSIDDPVTRAMSLKSGETDMVIDVAVDDLPLFDDKSSFYVSEVTSFRTALARLNVAPGRLLNDSRVRAALISACDRNTYTESLLKNSFIPGGPVIPPSLNYGFDQLRDPNTFNLERANQLLDEAGWVDTDGDGIREKDGQRLELNYVYYIGRSGLPTFVEATQADARKAGFDIKLQVVDHNALNSTARRGDYDLIIGSFLTTNTGDPEIFLNWYWKSNVDGSNPENGSGYSNPQYDALSDALAVEFDSDKRRDIIIQMQQLLLDDAAVLVYGYPKAITVSNTSLTGAATTPADYYWINKNIRPART